MAKENDYGAFRLRKETVEYLKTLKQAFELSYGRSFTNDDFIKQMATSVEEGDVAVWEVFCELSEKLDELKERVKKHRDINQS